MAELQLTPTALTVRLTRAEKIAGLLRDVELPLHAIGDVEVIVDPLTTLRGLRAPGLGLPRRRIGTWRRRGARTLVSVRAGQPAVRVHVHGAPYDDLLIGTDDAAGVAARISGAVSGAR